MSSWEGNFLPDIFIFHPFAAFLYTKRKDSIISAVTPREENEISEVCIGKRAGASCRFNPNFE